MKFLQRWANIQRRSFHHHFTHICEHHQWLYTCFEKSLESMIKSTHYTHCGINMEPVSLEAACSVYSKCDKRLCNEWKSESLAQELVYLRASKHRHCMNFAWPTISVLLAPPYNVCPHTQLHTHPLCYALVTLRKTVVVDHSTTQVIMTVCNQLLIWMPFERLVWSRGPGLRSLAGSCCLQSGFGLSR